MYEHPRTASRLVPFVRRKVEPLRNTPLSAPCKFCSKNPLVQRGWGDSNTRPSTWEGSVMPLDQCLAGIIYHVLVCNQLKHHKHIANDKPHKR